MSITAHPSANADFAEIPTVGHERVVMCRDETTGLRAIIAVHSSVLGPALGGTRFKAYDSEPDALKDVLRLSEGMTYKAAAAGLPLGGGKAVIIGDPNQLKTPELLAAYGRFVERFEGEYVTAADVGTTAEDLDVVGSTTKHVVGRTAAAGGSGDSGYSTALGVFVAMRTAAEAVWGNGGLCGRAVGVEGVGKVGRHLVDLLLAEGADVTVADPSDAAIQQLLLTHGGRIHMLSSVLDAEIDIYAPCALGATLSHGSVPGLHAQVVCGAANNQLVASDVDQALAARGVLWVPDFVANAGGLIQVGGELLGRTPDEVRRDVEGIAEGVKRLLEIARDQNLPTGRAAVELADERLGRSQPRP